MKLWHCYVNITTIDLVINVVFFLADDDGNNQWPEVLKFLFDSVNSDSVNLRESALHIFW